MRTQDHVHVVRTISDGAGLFVAHQSFHHVD
jgi:hypothetical protein